MRNLKYLLIGALLLTAGCAEESNDYILATIDGKPMEFRDNPLAIISGLDGRKEVLTFSASVEGSNGTRFFEVDLELPGGQLATTRYSANRAIASQPRPGFRLNDSLTAQYGPGIHGSYINDSGEHGTSGDFVVEVTRLDDSRVTGRFHGGLELGGRIIQVEKGAFSLAYEYKPRNSAW